MFISYLPLNSRSAQVRAELRDPYQMHRTLTRAFGDDKDQYERARCLFRVDEDRNRGVYVLVHSRVAPDWSFLPGRYLDGNAQVKELTPVLQSGAVLAFRLRANPTVKREGKRLGLYTDEERMAWLHRKGEKHGFEVRRVDISLQDKQNADRAGKDVTMSAVRFDGVLRVVDPGLLAEALETGIGSGKGFGFGLLSLAPVK